MSYSRAEVLRYLGYRGQEITQELEERIDEGIARCEEVSRPASVSATFAIRDASERTVTLEGCAVQLEGRDIARHLHDASEVVLVAATLGAGVDRELRRLSLTDPLGQVVFDAAATAGIERAVDEVEASIRADAAVRGLYCSWRFSPGYGDLPLDVQPQLLAALNATRRLGITLTSSNLMVPTKSVTAVVGLHAKPQPGLASSCSVCSLAEFCSLRTRGITCRGYVPQADRRDAPAHARAGRSSLGRGRAANSPAQGAGSDSAALPPRPRSSLPAK